MAVLDPPDRPFTVPYRNASFVHQDLLSFHVSEL
jgi:hypothetical protein